ncbi:alpha/beta hydrolase [Chryseolinea sp. T2]|uniref:alpha/beta hydrolase n=1 Tax=Chryseolinea sp. T2 TaxID=3129255 RepID=UPI0030784E7D
MNSRRLVRITFPIILLIGIYFIGSSPDRPTYNPNLPTVPADADGLERYVANEEANHKLKPDNNAVIIWNDSARVKTKYSVVYLHGFSASRMEGDPVHRDFAKKFGMNLYLARLSDHGVDTTEALLQFTPDRLWESGKNALQIGKQLGEKVILMGTSTGASLALMLAAQYPDDVYALINLSPNIEINNGAAFVANNPWGLKISRLVMGGNYNNTGGSEDEAKYWNTRYRLEAVGQLQELLETSMNDKLFRRVKQPSLTLYYYKDEENQDRTVRVDAILRMEKELGTPDDLKEAIAIPTAGGHVLGSSVVSKDIPAVEAAIEKFAIEKLKLEPR